MPSDHQFRHGNKPVNSRAIEPELAAVITERTCRYGHGELTNVSHIEGKQAFFLVPYSFYGQEVMELDTRLGPLEWHVCGTCGYSELVDITPSQTIKMMKAPENG